MRAGGILVGSRIGPAGAWDGMGGARASRSVAIDSHMWARVGSLQNASCVSCIGVCMEACTGAGAGSAPDACGLGIRFTRFPPTERNARRSETAAHGTPRSKCDELYVSWISVRCDMLSEVSGDMGDMGDVGVEGKDGTRGNWSRGAHRACSLSPSFDVVRQFNDTVQGIMEAYAGVPTRIVDTSGFDLDAFEDIRDVAMEMARLKEARLGPQGMRAIRAMVSAASILQISIMGRWPVVLRSQRPARRRPCGVVE